MAIPNIYWWNRGYFSGPTGTPAVYELVNGTQLNLIGDADIGDGLEGGAVDSLHGTNCIIEFKGKRYIWHKQYVKEENEGGTGNWGTIYDTGSGSSQQAKSGLFSILRNGALNLVGMQNTGGGNILAFRFDGTTFNQVTGGGNTTTCGTSIVYNNKLYWNVNNGAWEYDPVTDGIQFYSFGGTFGTLNRDFCVLNGELFAAGFNNDSGTEQEAKLWKLTDTGWEIQHTFDTGFIIDFDFPGSTVAGSPILFSPDNQSLIFISNGSNGTNDGDQAALIQNPGTASQLVTDITDPVIPAAFRPGGSNAVQTSRYIVFTDTQNSSVPTSPDIYIWRLSVQNAGNWGFYTYTDTSTELSFQGIGPSFQYIGAHIKRGGGSRISGGANATSTNKVYAELESPVVSSSLGSMDVSFRVYGTDTGLNGRVYVSSEQELPDTQITITSVSGGSATVSGSVIQNINADDGATLYTFTWPATADGIANGVPLTLIMDLST